MEMDYYCNNYSCSKCPKNFGGQCGFELTEEEIETDQQEMFEWFEEEADKQRGGL